MSGGTASGRRPGSGDWTYLALMVVIGSSTATAAKFAVKELPVGLLPLIRFGVAGLCLLPATRGLGSWRRMIREDGGRLLAAAALCVPINQAFFLNATRLAPTTHVAMFYAACPLVVLAIVVATGQERLVPGRLAGILACVAGVALIGLEGLWHSHVGEPGAWRGDLLLLGAVGSWGGYLAVNKPLVARQGAVNALAGTFLVGAALEVPIALATYPGWPPLSTVEPAAWWGLAHMTVIVSVFGLAFQNAALRRFDASQVAAVGNISPLLTIVWGALLLGESVTPIIILGGALTLGGVLWAGRPESLVGAGRLPVSVPVPVRPEPAISP